MKYLFALFFLVSQSVSFSASFDCTEKLSRVEALICADERLSDMDDELAVLYQFKIKGSSNQAVVAGQRAWLQQRNKCIDQKCVYQLYQNRLDALRAGGFLVLLNGKEVLVPEDKRFLVESFKPYKMYRSTSGGTADLYVEGQVILNEKMTVNGNFDLALGNGDSGMIEILGGSKISVGDSRGAVVYRIEKGD